MDLHHQYAVKFNTGYFISKTEKDGYGTTRVEAEAHTCWSRAGAARIFNDYIKKKWNKTMGDKPIFEVIKVHRPQLIHHAW